MEENQIGVYNPLIEDFSVYYDVNEDRSPILFTVPALDIAYFAPSVADHVKKHLVDKILNTRGVKTNWSDESKEVFKEISV